MLVRILLIILSSLIIVDSFAVGGNIQPRCDGPQCGWCDFFSDIKEAIDFFVYDIAFPVGGLMIVVGGILILLGGSSRNLVMKGKNMIFYAFIGVFIIFISWTVVSLIMKLLLNSPNINPWQGITC